MHRRHPRRAAEARQSGDVATQRNVLVAREEGVVASVHERGFSSEVRRMHEERASEGR